jgi:hypothetical protein
MVIELFGVDEGILRMQNEKRKEGQEKTLGKTDIDRGRKRQGMEERLRRRKSRLV